MGRPRAPPQPQPGPGTARPTSCPFPDDESTGHLLTLACARECACAPNVPGVESAFAGAVRRAGREAAHGRTRAFVPISKPTTAQLNALCLLRRQIRISPRLLRCTASHQERQKQNVFARCPVFPGLRDACMRECGTGEGGCGHHHSACIARCLLLRRRRVVCLGSITRRTRDAAQPCPTPGSAWRRQARKQGARASNRA